MDQIIEFYSANPILVTIFLVLLFLFLRTFIVSASAKSINTMEAVRMMNKEDAYVLDVRTQDEYQNGHIAGSTNVPVGLIDARIADIQYKKSDPMIIVCQSGNRSAQAAKSLKKHGFGNLFNLSGGMSGWQQANLPVETGKKSGGGQDNKSSKKKQRNISSSKKAESVPEAQPTDLKEEEKVVVYSSGYCPFTAKVQKLFKEKGVDYQQVNLSGDPETRKLIADRAGQTTFPQVFLGEEHIGNCDELYQLEKEGKLNSILGLKPAQGVF